MSFNDDYTSNISPAVADLPDPVSGAENLLVDYLKVQAGEKVILVLEPDESLYRKDVADVILKHAKSLGTDVTLFNEPLISEPADFPASVSNAMQSADHTIFLSRLGDYVRFLPLPGECTKTTCYIYSKEQLASPYATVSNSLLSTLRDQLEEELLAASTWRITCPLGSDISGDFDWPSLKGGADDELLISLFPVSTFKPVPAHNANGVVALSRWLMPGGSTKMEAQNLSFSGTVFCDVVNGEIQKFHGTGDSPAKVNQHYDQVASTLSINRNRVHSWHLGINPQTFFAPNAEDDMDTWCALSFASPRYLHFHTCGDEPPGEVAWSLFDCSVYIDEALYWHRGQFVWLQRDDNIERISQYPGAGILLENSLDIGI